MLTLRYKPLWIAASLLLVLTVVWGSLQVRYKLEMPVPLGFDKFEHFGTYLVLALWFTGILHRPRYWWAAMSLLGLGLTMEFTQWAMHAGRTADPFDMAANTLGVLTGMLLGFAWTGGWAKRVEEWLQ